mmetsp:Transcript_35596/g.114416  ORF Transcript_35596/g.114416 Transcript_35596/m.114416 type:complete len:99 (+) Transcript_35596:404-700(+)
MQRGEPYFLLWVNPGEVKVLRGKGLPQYIYQEGSRQANPYDTGLRLKIERTVVNVSLDTPIDLDAQSSRQLVSPAGPHARGATLAPAGTVVEPRSWET